MKYTELSIEKLKSEWAKELKKTYCPDLVIYVARAGYLIGKEMSEVFEVPMVGISATREGNKLKECRKRLRPHRPAGDGRAADPQPVQGLPPACGHCAGTAGCAAAHHSG